MDVASQQDLVWMFGALLVFMFFAVLATLAGIEAAETRIIKAICEAQSTDGPMKSETGGVR